MGILVLYRPDALAVSVGSTWLDDPHPGAGLRTVYIEPYKDLADANWVYLFDRGLVAGAAQRVVTLVMNSRDTLDHNWVMPVMPATPEVYFRGPEGRSWDLSIRLPTARGPRPTAYE